MPDHASSLRAAPVSPSPTEKEIPRVKGIVHVASAAILAIRRPLARSFAIAMSFFDDDEQPTRTARPPRPRRASGRASGGSGGRGPSDSQQLMIRRAGALGVLVIVLIIIVLGFRACQSS